MQIPEFITFFETTRPTPQPVSIYHGACADLVAVIQTNGDTIDERTLADYTATALFEVLSDSDEDDEEEVVSDENGDIAVIGPTPKQYFEIPVEIKGNTCIVKWQGNLDSGANAIKIYLRLTKTDEPTVIAYPATWTVRFQESPGFNPAMLEPLPEEIDFDIVKYVNAPWVTLSDYNSALSSFNNTIDSLSDSIDEISDATEYLLSDITEIRQDVVNAQSDITDLQDNKADKSDVIPASSLIVLKEPDYIESYESRYIGEYPLWIEMNKNPDDEWASYDYIQLDPVMGLRMSNQYNELVDVGYYGVSISEIDGNYSTMTGHSLEFNFSGMDEQKTMTITQDGIEKTVYNYMNGDYTTTTIEWPDTNGKLALTTDIPDIPDVSSISTSLQGIKNSAREILDYLESGVDNLAQLTNLFEEFLTALKTNIQ